MGIWSTLFSSSSTIEKTTDAVISAGDKIWYTDEEKADNKIKLIQYFPTLLKAYEPFKIAQRILAIWFSFLFGVAFLTGIGMEIFNIVIKYKALVNGVKLENIILLDTAPIINIVTAFSLGTIVLAIITFYFLGGSIESFRKVK